MIANLICDHVSIWVVVYILYFRSNLCARGNDIFLYQIYIFQYLKFCMMLILFIYKFKLSLLSTLSFSWEKRASSG